MRRTDSWNLFIASFAALFFEMLLVRWLPTTIYYDAAGKEVWRVVGEYDWSSAAAREAVAEGTR